MPDKFFAALEAKGYKVESLKAEAEAEAEAKRQT